MKQIILSLSICAFAIGILSAQQDTELNIGKRLGVYVFPTNGQDADTQDLDEYKCYKWAMDASGIDPLTINVAPAQVSQAPDGSAMKGATKGAAVGGLIGAIAGNTGKGMAIGATTGLFGGMGHGAAHKQQEQQMANQEAAQKEAELKEDFNKAFSACMEGKGYTVK